MIKLGKGQSKNESQWADIGMLSFTRNIWTYPLFLLSLCILPGRADSQTQSNPADTVPPPVFTVTARSGPKGILTDSETQTSNSLPPVLDQMDILSKQTQQISHSNSVSFVINNEHTMVLQLIKQSNETARIRFDLQKVEGHETSISLVHGIANFKLREYLLLNGFPLQNNALYVVITRNELNPNENGEFDSSKDDSQQEQPAEQKPQPKPEQQKEQQQEEEPIQEDKPSEEMTPEEAAMMLDAMKAQEQSQRDRLHPFFGRPVPVEKDW